VGAFTWKDVQQHRNIRMKVRHQRHASPRNQRRCSRCEHHETQPPTLYRTGPTRYQSNAEQTRLYIFDFAARWKPSWDHAQAVYQTRHQLFRRFRIEFQSEASGRRSGRHARAVPRERLQVASAPPSAKSPVLANAASVGIRKQFLVNLATGTTLDPTGAVGVTTKTHAAATDGASKTFNYMTWCRYRGFTIGAKYQKPDGEYTFCAAPDEAMQAERFLAGSRYRN
jgi:hypothetical protein